MDVFSLLLIGLVGLLLVIAVVVGWAIWRGDKED